MSELRNKILEHAETAVRNIRRSLALGGYELYPELIKGKKQLEDTLLMWEYMLTLISIPENPAIELAHYQLVVLKGELEVAILLRTQLEEKLKLKEEQIAKLKDQEKSLENLRNICETQCRPGNHDYDEYMRGMANGLILAVSCFTGDEPKYIEPPLREDTDAEDESGETAERK